MVAIGLALPWPAMSGAEPWTGSYMPKFPSARLADGSMPMDPVIWLASSERMSPNMLLVTSTSKCFGSLTSCMAALSTYMWSSSTSGYSAESSVITFLHRRELSRTLALSTLVTLLFRFMADSNALIPILRISASLYSSVSLAIFWPSWSTVSCFPKYMPPVSSLTMRMSRPEPRISFLRGEASAS